MLSAASDGMKGANRHEAQPLLGGWAFSWRRLDLGRERLANRLIFASRKHLASRLSFASRQVRGSVGIGLVHCQRPDFPFSSNPSIFAEWRDDRTR
jgi:hypothetical protein